MNAIASVGGILAAVIIACCCAGDPTPKTPEQLKQQAEERKQREEERKKEEAKRITLAKYNDVKTGMTYDQVVEVLGAHGKENSRVDVGGILTVMVSWSNPNGSNMNVTFQNGQVRAKAQFGLE